MSYLLYCGFRSGPPPELEAPTGIHGKPLFILSHGGLSVGVSEIAQFEAAPSVATVLAFESAVEFFFRRQTVIPMRYGCWIRDRAEVDAWLDLQHKEREVLLARLDGLAEMGIRITVGPPNADCPIDSTDAQLAKPDEPMGSGVSYLLNKKQCYGVADRTAEQRDGLAKTVCQTLSGLFVRHKVEVSRGTAPVVSVYFLVPRTYVDLFRQTTREYIPQEFAKLTVSGPWPPYNFVQSSNISDN